MGLFNTTMSIDKIKNAEDAERYLEQLRKAVENAEKAGNTATQKLETKLLKDTFKINKVEDKLKKELKEYYKLGKDKFSAEIKLNDGLLTMYKRLSDEIDTLRRTLKIIKNTSDSGKKQEFTKRKFAIITIITLMVTSIAGLYVSYNNRDKEKEAITSAMTSSESKSTEKKAKEEAKNSKNYDYTEKTYTKDEYEKFTQGHTDIPFEKKDKSNNDTATVNGVNYSAEELNYYFEQPEIDFKSKKQLMKFVMVYSPNKLVEDITPKSYKLPDGKEGRVSPLLLMEIDKDGTLYKELVNYKKQYKDELLKFVEVYKIEENKEANEYIVELHGKFTDENQGFGIEVAVDKNTLKIKEAYDFEYASKKKPGLKGKANSDQGSSGTIIIKEEEDISDSVKVNVVK